MAVWPFRRKSRRKRPHSGGLSEGDPTSGDISEDQARARRRKTEPAPQVQPTKRQPNKLQRRERSLSFEKGREDALAVERRRTSRKRKTGAPLQGPVGPRSHLHSKYRGAPNPDRSYFDQDNFPRMPTLHLKRDGEHLSRKMSTKRRKADHAREAEIRALGFYEPTRPAAEPWQTGRPMKKDTRKVKSGLGLGFRRSWEREQPVSDVSLPFPGSVHSSLSSDSEHVSFKVSALEALAPRPTLRYAVCPRYSNPSVHRPDRHVSVRNKVSEKEPIPEATLRAHKRIDDLANDLTASDLRELMERDERRRARKTEREQERLERRLARRAEKEKAAQREGRHSPPNMDRGVMGRESVGLGIEPEGVVVTSSRSRSPPNPSSKQLGKRPAAEMEDEGEASGTAHQGPLEHFHRTDSIPLDNVSVASDVEARPVQRSESPRKKIILMPRLSRSKSPPVSNPPMAEAPESLRKTSEGSIKRMRRSWSNLFRWGSRSKRNAGPSSFSNTSRDSMSAIHTPSATIPAALTRKLSSNVPKRTMSRFREDLPELPLSPPDSRAGSPEAFMPPAIMEQDSPDLDSTMDLDNPTPKRRDTPMSPDEATGSVPASMPTTVDPSPEPVAMSMGSIDSEGSWFGTKRTSVQRVQHAPLSPPHFSHRRGESESTFDSHDDPDLPKQDIIDDEDSYIADDEYLSRFANQRSSGSHMTNARPSSDISDDARWGIVGGQHPNVVETHAGNLIKSREGLLNTFSEDDNGSELSLDSAVEENELKRANSGVRHPKGSAKLFKVTPRTSVEAKRISVN